ncbi:phenylalanine--tRNA ligase subunit beta [Breznakiellaceae bacterium SP9]
MPKIEVNEEAFYNLVGRRWDTQEQFEQALTCAKAELDEGTDEKLPPLERTLKIELNDTNRPDLWSMAGCARQLRCVYTGERPEYPFFSRPGDRKTAAHKVLVERSVKAVRPYMAGFVASGRPITDASLRDNIQTQEKLAWNFGRKRRTISMGLYRRSKIKWPIIYKAVDPDSVSFVPLQWDGPLTLREILTVHPKGKEYAFIQEHEPLHPLLLDVQGAILSYPPIINSADLGAVQVGDTDLFVELTGTDQPSVTLAASIMACDLADQGFAIEPVEVEYEYDTPFGRSVVTPYYFQTPVFCGLNRVEKYLGERLDSAQCLNALTCMGVKAQAKTALERGEELQRDCIPLPHEGILAWPPEYRNDYLHAADVMEDIMIGRALYRFKPERPQDFTIGRLSPITLFSRKVKEILVGLGYQEMIFNYLGSRKDFVDNMLTTTDDPDCKIIQISNPMTENYEFVRDCVFSSLIMSEAASGHAAYPHRIFEIGKVVYRNEAENDGTSTRQHAGLLIADKDANFNTAAAQMQTIFYYIGCVYTVEESQDRRFIPGRAASILFNQKPVGIFGEVHPAILEKTGIGIPCIAAELDIEALMSA